MLAGWASGVPKIHPRHALAVFRNKDLWSGLLLTGVFAAALALVQFATPSLVGNDGYYHIKMAYLLRTEGFKPAFEWLPLTVLNPQEYYDHHYLFHILMIPFTFGDLRLGAKLASVLFPALAFASVWWLLKSQRVPYSGLWSLGLLLNPYFPENLVFIYRHLAPKLGDATAVAVGNEWYPYTTATLIGEFEKTVIFHHHRSKRRDRGV